ncbi:MAG: SPOR domain-containing protein [Pseudomonadales bacterium]|nr:SPOR domain-containing protein [Pseudomonadales bacterium]
MRIFVLLMLFLNLSYVGWQLWDAPRSALVMVQAAAEVAPVSLQLLTEVTSQAEPPGRIETASCFTIGPFGEDSGEGERLQSYVGSLGYQSSLRFVEVMEEPDYWVHLPPFASDAAALRKLEELRAKKIDSYLINSGDLIRGISLGLFSRRAFALALQERLASQGYASVIAEVPRSYKEVWLDISGLPPEGLNTVQWAEFSEGRADFHQAEKLCETIAPKL